MTVSDRIKEKRLDLQMSQSELARLAGYSDKTAISKIENSGNNITMKQLRRVAKALHVSAAYLMGWEKDQDMPTAHKEMLEEYVNRERLSQYSQEEITRALNFLDAFTKASPEIQAAIETLLKGRQSDF